MIDFQDLEGLILQITVTIFPILLSAVINLLMKRFGNPEIKELSGKWDTFEDSYYRKWSDNNKKAMVFIFASIASIMITTTAIWYKYIEIESGVVFLACCLILGISMIGAVFSKKMQIYFILERYSMTFVGGAFLLWVLLIIIDVIVCSFQGKPVILTLYSWISILIYFELAFYCAGIQLLLTNRRYFRILDQVDDIEVKLKGDITIKNVQSLYLIKKNIVVTTKEGSDRSKFTKHTYPEDGVWEIKRELTSWYKLEKDQSINSLFSIDLAKSYLKKTMKHWPLRKNKEIKDARAVTKVLQEYGFENKLIIAGMLYNIKKSKKAFDEDLKELFGDEITLLITSHAKRETLDITAFAEELEKNGLTEDLSLECAWSFVSAQEMLNNIKKNGKKRDYLKAQKNELGIMDDRLKALLPIRDQSIYCDLQKINNEIRKILN